MKSIGKCLFRDYGDEEYFDKESKSLFFWKVNTIKEYYYLQYH